MFFKKEELVRDFFAAVLHEVLLFSFGGILSAFIRPKI